MIVLNLHGINFIFTEINDLGCGPWFLSVIMCCYILFLGYSKIKDRHKKVDRLFSCGGVIPLGVFVALSLIGIRIEGILAFFIGYNLKAKEYHLSNKTKNFFVAAISFISALGVRLLSKKFFDGKVTYNDILAPLSHVVLAASIIIGFKWLFDVLPNFMNGITKSKLFRHLDKISIDIYVSHDIMFFVLNWKMPIYILMPVYLVIALFTATVLWLIGGLLTKYIERFTRYCFG